MKPSHVPRPEASSAAGTPTQGGQDSARTSTDLHGQFLEDEHASARVVGWVGAFVGSAHIHEAGDSLMQRVVLVQAGVHLGLNASVRVALSRNRRTSAPTESVLPCPW
jgi:hypothetical protein